MLGELRTRHRKASIQGLARLGTIQGLQPLTTPASMLSARLSDCHPGCTLGIAVFLRMNCHCVEPKSSQSASVISSEGGITLAEHRGMHGFARSRQPDQGERARSVPRHQPVALFGCSYAVGLVRGARGQVWVDLGPERRASSILRRAELRRFTPTVIVAGFDVLGCSEPEDIPRLAVNRIVAAARRLTSRRPNFATCI